MINPPQNKQKTLTGVVYVAVGQLGMLYKTVCHVSEHDTRQRKRCPINHGRQRPNTHQQNVPAVCKPELHMHQRERKNNRNQYLQFRNNLNLS